MPACDGIAWAKSSYSANTDSCVEVAPLPDGGMLIRDSKLGDASPVLRFTAAEWRAFVAGVRDGEFDT
jgi:Domain of unknown function (DUF397)